MAYLLPMLLMYVFLLKFSDKLDINSKFITKILKQIQNNGLVLFPIIISVLHPAFVLFILIKIYHSDSFTNFDVIIHSSIFLILIWIICTTCQIGLLISSPKIDHRGSGLPKITPILIICYALSMIIIGFSSGLMLVYGVAECKNCRYLVAVKGDDSPLVFSYVKKIESGLVGLKKSDARFIMIPWSQVNSIQ